MAWLTTLFSASQTPDQRLPVGQQQRLREWWQLPAANLALPHHQSRYVVVDVEGGGFESRADNLLIMGALAVTNGLIDFNDVFQFSLAEGGGANAPTLDPRITEGLIDFLHFVGKSPLVVYHAMFAAKAIERTLANQLRVELVQPCLDLALVMSDLFRDIGETNWRLDAWLEHFNINSIDRHRAISDAYATAQLLQIAMARAARNGFPTPEGLFEVANARRQMYPDR